MKTINTMFNFNEIYKNVPQELNRSYRIRVLLRQILWLSKSTFRIRKKFKTLKTHLNKSANFLEINNSSFHANPHKETEITVFGPWLGELGFEVLYWAPFVNSLASENDIALSRGGTGFLYPKLSYLEGFDYLDKNKWLGIQKNRVRFLGGEKQRDWLLSELKLMKKIQVPVSRILHPKQMFSSYGFNSKLEYDYQLSLLEKFSRDVYNSDGPRFEQPLGDQHLLLAPYSRQGLGHSQILDFLSSDTFKSISNNFNVQTISDAYIDIHHEFTDPSISAISRQHRLPPIEFKTNLSEKKKLIMNSSRVVTTDGGLAYLSLLLGKDTWAIRGESIFWDEYHSSMARELSKLMRCKYVILSLNENGKWIEINHK